MSTTLESRVALLEAQLAELTKPTKAKKEKKEKSEEPKKKRGTSGYLVFAKETRPEAKKLLMDGGNETPKPTEVLTQVAKQWRELGDEEKGEWNEKAKAINSGSESEADADAEAVEEATEEPELAPVVVKKEKKEKKAKKEKKTKSESGSDAE